MSYYIKHMKLDNTSYSFIGMDDSNAVLEHLSKVNLFVGSNNSGKSRLLRNLFERKDYYFIPQNLDIAGINKVIEYLNKELKSLIDSKNLVDIGGLLETSNGISKITYIKSSTDYITGLNRLINILYNADNSNSLTLTTKGFMSSTDYIVAELKPRLKDLGKKYLELLEKSKNGNPSQFDFDKIYIPTLRGLRPLSENDNVDLYLNRTISDYFNKEFDENIFTGSNLYEMLKEHLLGDLEEREVISDFQHFLSNEFFNGEAVALIPSLKTKVINVKIGTEKEQPIYNLGDGIQSLIILTFPLFMNRGKNLLVFMEEPELYLHPGMQRKLIETLMRPEFFGFQYFITTHSNHFLDLTLDIENVSIYTFKKELDDSEEKQKTPKFIIENVSNENASALELIGVKNSSVFLSNCTIWVEGITDRYYLRRYLSIYQKYLNEIRGLEIYKEDLHYSFVEYSGGNITHWSFLDDETEQTDASYSRINVDRICNKLFLITDKDSEEKLTRQEKLSEKLGERYYCLECKEIENVLCKDVLLKVISEYEGTEVENIGFLNDSFEENEYKNVYLGEFIKDRIKNQRRRGSYAAPSGTVSQKVDFCKRAVKHINSIDDMSEQAIDLCKKIYQFIEKNNT